MAALLEGIAAILEAEGVQKVHVVGPSFGGWVAQCFVRRFPEKVATLILSDTGLPRKGRALAGNIPRDAQRDAYLTEAALQTRPVLSLSFLMRSEIPLEDCYLFDEAGSWSGKPKKATSDGP